MQGAVLDMGLPSVVVVVNAHAGPPKQTQIDLRAVLNREPEVSEFFVDVDKVCARDPERGLLGRLSLDAANGKVRFIHPDSAPKEILVGRARLGTEDIGSQLVVKLLKREGVIPSADFDVVARRHSSVCLLSLQHGLENAALD